MYKRQTQRGAHNIAIKGVRENDESTEHQDEHILIPVSNEESVRELVTLGNVLKSKKNHNGFYALHAIDNKVEDSGLEKRARKILETAATAAAALKFMLVMEDNSFEMTVVGLILPPLHL